MPVIVLRLAEPTPIVAERPTHCPYCGSEVFQRWGATLKNLQDTDLQTIENFRYHCSGCGHTFRNDSQTDNRTNLTQRIRKLAGLTWALGLSSREVVDVFKEVGFELNHMTVWRDGHELITKYFNTTDPDHPPRYKIDKLFLKYRGKGIGTSILLDLGKEKSVLIGKVDESNPRVLLSWLEPVTREFGIQAFIFGTDILDRYRSS
jgi:DNA-directed RNA polymerase subunit RPC12/RpoP